MTGLISLLAPMASVVKTRLGLNKTQIDSLTFRLHYVATTTLFFTFSILITGYNFVGQPILCIGDYSKAGFGDAINTYCWITNTFSMSNIKSSDVELPRQFYPGIGPDNGANSRKVQHAYYQWVTFMLFFQGILFYIPHWIWKYYEGGLVAKLTEKIRGSPMSVIHLKIKRRRQLERCIVDYLVKNLKTHNARALLYFLCEIFNLVIVVVNIFLINHFLGGVFFEYGFKVIEFAFQNQENRIDPMIEVFPRITKCIFRNYGPSGKIQVFDSLCILAVNIINEKVYIFLWFWLFFLLLVSIVSLTRSLIVMLSKRGREFALHHFLTPDHKGCLEELVNKMQIGDLWLLQLLAKNLSSAVFSQVAVMLRDRLSHNHTAQLPKSTKSSEKGENESEKGENESEKRENESSEEEFI